jgi:transportin-1
VVIAIGPGFANYAQPVFERCIQIVKSSLVAFQQYQADPINYDEPDKTFLIVSLDLLSGLTQGLNTAITQLYASSDPPVLTLLAHCLQVSPLCHFYGSSCTADEIDVMIPV